MHNTVKRAFLLLFVVGIFVVGTVTEQMLIFIQAVRFPLQVQFMTVKVKFLLRLKIQNEHTILILL